MQKRPPLKSSDHEMLYMQPVYKKHLQSSKPKTTEVQVYTTESLEDLGKRFELTDWDIFTEICADLDELTETVTSYIPFCEDMLVPTKTIKSYLNNTPWMSANLKKLVAVKHHALSEYSENKYDI